MAGKPKGGSKKPKITKKKRRAIPKPTAINVREMASDAPPAEVSGLGSAIQSDGGVLLASYREPIGGTWLLLCGLPIDQVAPTPYQRDLSPAHAGKMVEMIGKLGRFLDPIIAVRHEAKSYWTPNGHHRLAALRELGAQAITALVVPDAATAYQILALNTEKGHNLRERALEVIRMARELATLSDDTEERYALEFEEAALVTLGLCYEENGRFAGGAYHPILRRCDVFLKKPLMQALEQRRTWSARLQAVDSEVSEKVKTMKEHGLQSPYLKAFVVGRINPIRFRPKDKPPLSIDDVLERMTSAVQKFNADKVNVKDLAGAPPVGED